jgi:hypothetical protein
MILTSPKLSGVFLPAPYTVTDRTEGLVGTYSLEELVRRWQTGDLTVEQAIGQILLALRELAAQIRELEQAQIRKQRDKTPRS